MSSHKLADCSDIAMVTFQEFELQLDGANIFWVRTCTYRSPAEQAKLYAQGRTSPGHIVTHARPGQSRHNDEHNGRPASNACDYYPVFNGKLCGDQTDADLHLWGRMGKIARACGLEWGGDWPGNSKDRPHFQMPKPLTPD